MYVCLTDNARVCKRVYAHITKKKKRGKKAFQRLLMTAGLLGPHLLQVSFYDYLPAFLLCLIVKTLLHVDLFVIYSTSIGQSP